MDSGRWKSSGRRITVGGVTTVLLVLTHIAMNRKSPAFTSLLEESAALLESGPDRWGRAHVLNLRGYEALNNLDLDRAQDLYTASHELAVELGDRAGQAENLLALGHLHLLRAETEEADRALQENRSVLEQLHDHHQLAHADQALALLAISSGRDAEGEALFQDVTRRLREMGLTMMGGSTHSALQTSTSEQGDQTLQARCSAIP